MNPKEKSAIIKLKFTMKKFMRAMLIMSIGVVFISQSFAKGKKVKFGKVSMEELKMKEYALDTSAVAVVLFEKGYYDGTNHKFFKHIRYKILKKEGLAYANSKYNTTARGFIKGITFNLENGNIVETKLDNDNIYAEKVWDYYYIYDVAMPNVKVGSVLDIKISYDGFPPTWYFQRNIPVVLSELELSDNQYLTFRKQIGGLIPPENVGYNHWKVENMPAFISEAYISSEDNYLSRIELDINETHFPGYYRLNFTTSWKDEQTLLNKFYSFGKALEWPNNFLNKYAQEIEEKATTDEEKAKLAVEKVKSIIDWDKRNRLFISEDNLSEVTHEKDGNSADINLLLVALLQKLDMEVYPMVMSTRENGMLHPVNPSLNKLNYVIAYVRINGEFMMLDATSQHLAWNMLPIRCLNYSGQVFDDKETYRAIISPKEKYAKRIYYDLTLDNNFALSGKLSYSDMDYAAYDFRRTYASYLSDQDYVENLMDKFEGLNIMDYSIENVNDLDKSVTQKYDVEIEDVVSVIDDQLYINMFLFEKMGENPFKSQDRSYPVDFAYTRATSGVIRIAVPENYTVAELPKPVSVTLPENSAKFTMIYQMAGNVLTLNYKLLINRSVFPENAYPFIKEFYAQIIDNESKTVILNINN